ncbi:YidC/Oxa1 family membrane protein insertase [Geosporobacter subterraneus DSM 17957]|jgi:YidC/Oxa1 family membrane protein insertase|uniref:YidC/Oxa1 family membrane protein insertase n=1 Tax=Geosporobacter subterraneus DSM 17957 TaxID=1121919 RepID=A0A1M6MYS8_9FIRM|nr:MULTISPECIES: YidC/Oxa1 family membrane protein insertase [Clostridia]SHJ88641.1 YidC/Oxa1 family membrane protein insertase [Geosporobacter subterraneus DSM 17957]
MLDFIAIPMGYVLKFIYDMLAFKNYGIAIILLTVMVKTLLLPLYIKQYHSTSKLSEIQPQMQEIQKRYKNDKEKLNEEMMKLYQENKVNPAGGCLPLLIQMPILFSLYYVISQPLRYMVGKSPETILHLFEKIPIGPDRISNIRDLSIITYFGKHTEELASVSQMLKKEELLNMNFLGINLGAIPTWNYQKLFGDVVGAQNLILLLIPILSAITTYISVKYSMQQTPQTSDNQMQASMQKSMMWVSPVMTAFISFSVPAGLGLYWIVGNIYQIAQQMFMNRFVIKKNVKVEVENKEVKERKNSGGQSIRTHQRAK